MLFSFFFFNDTATTEIYTLSLHDALPISDSVDELRGDPHPVTCASHATFNHVGRPRVDPTDRKSTRLNSSHSQISYAVFCLKKKKKDVTARRYTFRLHTSLQLVTRPITDL